jgi:transcriptional regulator with XRE-family HTH domain
MTWEVVVPPPQNRYRPPMVTTMATLLTQSVGDLLREWRERRRLSQLALALDAGVSARHLSFLETGRARPSREMLLRLMEHLEVPLRERNRLLLAAGFAPLYPQRPLDDPALAAARAAIDRVLTGHEPYPALAVDRWWTLIAANRAVAVLTVGIAPAMLEPPLNVLRLSLHPHGLAPRIANLAEWRAHLLARLGRQVAHSGDARLARLRDELAAYPAPGGESDAAESGGSEPGEVAVPLRLRGDGGPLTFLSTTMIFGTPVDVTLSELAIEAFFPADASTAETLRRLAAE